MRYFETMTTQTKRIFGSVATAVVVIITALVFRFATTYGKVVVTVQVVPKDSLVTVNGKKTSAGTQWLGPGEYEFAASKDGFSTASDKVAISKGSPSKTVRLLPTPTSSEAITWVSNNSGLYKNIEGQAGEEVQKEGAAFTDKNPIVSSLPYKNLLFSIDYANDDSGSGIKLVIGGDTPNERRLALSQIKNWGYNPYDYVIVFTNFVNPLGDK